MACFFRRKIAEKLGRALQQSEDVFIPALTAVPVLKKQQGADFRLLIGTLRASGILPSSGDIQVQTENLATQLKQDNVVEHISAARGIINFKVNRKLLAQKLLEPFGNGENDKFGLNSELFNTLTTGTTLVEYSSPNIAKKFHAGHLRSTIIGNFIANLKQSLGNDVIRMNYLGDWGMQFGLLGAGFGQFGSPEKLKQNPLQHLFEVYVRVNKEAENNEDMKQAARDFFRQLEQHESHVVSLWQQFRDITVKEYQDIYERLGVHFDVYSGESFHQDQAQEVVQQLQSRGLLKTSEKGTGVVDLSPNRDKTNVCTVLRSDGTTLYITRDIAAAINRKEKYSFDEMIYVTDKSQENHFSQLFQILLAMGHSWADGCRHVSFGLVQGMKTRAGEVVFLEDVLDEARARMLNNMSQSNTTKELENPEDTAEKVGISALIIQDFKGPLQSDYKFNWDRMLQAQGDTGVFLQYTHARLCSLKQTNKGVEAVAFDPSLLSEQTCTAILQHLLRYDEVLYQSAQDLQPKHLVNFLLKLCHLIASAHRELPVKGSPEAVAQVQRKQSKVTNVQRSMLSPGQRDENPGHHTSKQNVKTASVCVSVLFSAATIVDLYPKNRALYCQNKIMLVCRIGSSLYSEKHFSANKNCTITFITRQH
ncbi:putative arginine--tRNA ligase, mitochondrial isoform X1 [Pundamilia nyererei]|uniref:Probable arginine--tRNA ligase, mitochondrial n=1 Tax=Pundamilia nyererei TaxID=303518 RepID=A0A9Y3VIF8_9CICH|nr:PREDICTED: probable arginine--tRNA ligase, mitochondrial isoform X1 [Pundamilia nyererei]